ncbi:EmrB/QacA subfamily drug resistance transporter [Paludibacterium purpuratum]|uniref:EmrB/QacA subfamily drug resistance transporter n=2 Tax=Paludibacterium purpuratum TaxID=1144873 RepID=A0A4R7B5G3_9NEIS|nr:EmrB/QacA subfamily drug resistance transporter [Paludibacterium purpuratum]
MLMENMDATVITTSLPAIAHELGYSPVILKLALTAYVAGLGIFIPASGWMADRFGARRVFSAAIVVFMAGSLGCALSQSLAGFVLARFVQGIGGAMMVPVGRIVIFRTIPKSELIRAIGYLTIPALLGPVIGPPIGGFITTYFDWRWIFLINVPISAVGLWLSSRYLQHWRDDHCPPLDWPGFLLSGIGSAMAMLGLALVGSGLLPAAWIWLLCLLGAVLLYAYWRHAANTDQPLLDLNLLRLPTLRASVLGGSFFRLGLGATPFLLPLSLQVGMGHSAFVAGLVTCASAIGAITMKTIAAPLLQRFGYRRVMLVNACLCGLVLAGYGLFGPTTPLWLMMAVVLFGGLFPSLQFTCLNTIIYADITDQDISKVTSLASVVQQLSLGLGVTIAGLAVEASRRLQGHTGLHSDDFWPAFALIGLFSILSVLPTRQLPAQAGQTLTAQPEQA